MQEPPKFKPNFAYINFYTISEIKEQRFKLKKFAPFFDFLFILKKDFNITVFDHIGKTVSFVENGVRFEYIKKRFNKKLLFPWKSFLKLRKSNPEIVYVQGLDFPHFILVMRLFLKPSTKILVHEHANRHPKKWQFLYKWADNYIHTYFFTSKELAKPWIKSKIIGSNNKIVECIEGSTQFTYNASVKKDKNSFLWVARLDDNKDPLTVLKAFSEYVKLEPKAFLTMFYENTTLLQEVKKSIKEKSLENNVELKGKFDHKKLEKWFQKSAFFILGSHKEGGSISLIEAMACGCIPIVTNIPANSRMIKQGMCGFLFSPRNNKELSRILKNLKNTNLDKMRNKVIHTFQKEMSHFAIAEKIKDSLNKN